MTYQDWMS